MALGRRSHVPRPGGGALGGIRGREAPARHPSGPRRRSAGRSFGDRGKRGRVWAAPSIWREVSSGLEVFLLSSSRSTLEGEVEEWGERLERGQNRGSKKIEWPLYSAKKCLTGTM